MDSRLDDCAARARRAEQHRVRDKTIAVLAAVGLLLAALPMDAPAAGNVASGKRLYQARCSGCHGDKSRAPTVGPSLVGVVGRKAGTEQTGVHSRALTESDVTWDAASLRKFLAAPTRQLSGTNMPEMVNQPQEIEDIIAYLETMR